MKTIIAGSRTAQWHHVHDAMKSCPWADEITEVVNGCAKGADTWGGVWATRQRLPVRKFPADWDRYGKAAGPMRNEAMATYADALILVWDGVSRGSQDMLERAETHGLRVYVHRFEQEQP